MSKGGSPLEDRDIPYAPESVELVRQGQRGDAAAVNELFTRYIPRVRRILGVKITPGQRSLVDPEDVLQETLIVANRRLAELEVRTPASILQWLSKIADYEIKNRLEYVRAQKRDHGREQRLGTATDPQAGPGMAVPVSDPSPSQIYAREEMEGLIDRELQQLEPPDYREVILLHDYIEADWERIRETLGRPSVAAVQDLYHRAMKRLRERVGKWLG